MKTFYEMMLTMEAGDAEGDKYEKAISEIGEMFDWLRSKIHQTWGGSRGRIAMDSAAKRQAASQLKQILSMLDDQVSEGVVADKLGLEKREDGKYHLDAVLTAMRDKIINIISGLKHSAVMDAMHTTKGEIMGGIKGLGSELGRIRSGDMNITDMDTARYNLQDLLKSVSLTNKVVYYRSQSGRMVPAQASPNDSDSLERLLRLVVRGGSSRVLVAEKGKTDKGVLVDLNNTGRIAQVRTDAMRRVN